MRAEFITPTDSSWQEFLQEVSHDFYHLPDFAAFSGRHEGGLPSAFLARDGAAGVLIPLLLRKLPEALGAPPNWCDATSPYGYPSPLFHPATDSFQAERFLRAFTGGCQELDIVAVFLRFHPLLSCPLGAFAEHGTVVQHGRTVWIDLTADSDQLRRQTRENHRRGIARLQQAGFHARIDHWNDRPGFVDAYSSTMKRLNAHPFYRFPERYFDDLHETLGDKLHLCSVVSPTKEVAAAGLFIATDRLVQYHLGGTAEQYLELAPSKLMFDHVRNWAKGAGCTAFHLGGGVGGRNDSLFRFKLGFSSLTADFHTCRMVLNHARYSSLSRKFREYEAGMNRESDDYFPIYRG